MSAETYKKQQAAIFENDYTPQPERKRDFAVMCKISDDGMSAAMRIAAASAECDVTETDVISRLYRAGVRSVCDYEKISKAISGSTYGTDIEVARGFRPEKGEDAVISRAFELREFITAEMAKNFPGQRLDPGVPVELDDPILIKTPAGPGKPGMNVRGRRLDPIPGKDAQFEFGENAVVSEDGLKVMAAMPGLAGLSNGTPAVRERDYDEWRFKIKVRKNGMEAVLTIIPGVTKQPETGEDFVAGLLESNGIKFGIEEAIHRRIPANIRNTITMTVARGEPPRQGESAVIIEHFRDGAEPGQTMHRVTSGQLISEKIPAQKGVRGRNVLDEPAEPAPGGDVPLTAGTNTSLSDDGLKLFATADGVVSREKEAYCIVPLAEFVPERGRLPRRIDHDGAVLVHGDVPAGTLISAAHHVEIAGGISSALVAAGGALTVRGGAVGCGGAGLQAGGEMHLKFAERSRLIGAGDIVLDTHANGCDITAGEKVRKSGEGRCTFTGGRVSAKKEIETDVLGTIRAEPTIAEAGVTQAMRTRMEHAARETGEVIGKLRFIEGEIAKLKKLLAEKTITREQVETLKKLMPAHSAVSERARFMAENLKKLQAAARESSRNARIRAFEAANAGVTVRIGSAAIKLERAADKPVFTLDETGTKIIATRM